LWYTGCPGSPLNIGRMSTAGAVKIYMVQNISNPVDITAGPDGAMWFTANNVIGRITTSVTPQISGFTPTSGPAGTAVTITGLNLSGATKVSFGGTAATIVTDTATQIVTTVPTGAHTGPILVTTAAGTARVSR
jgi:streptogramin lyase